jgi:hypothetical protein
MLSDGQLCDKKNSKFTNDGLRRHNAAADSHINTVWLHLVEVAVADTAQYYVDGICRSSSWSPKTSRLLSEFYSCLVYKLRNK